MTTRPGMGQARPPGDRRDGSLRGRSLALLGLATVARLLAGCDPFGSAGPSSTSPTRSPSARSLMPGPEKRSNAVSQLEAMLLKAARERLTLEGRLGPPHPDDRTKENDVR